MNEGKVRKDSVALALVGPSNLLEVCGQGLPLMPQNLELLLFRLILALKAQVRPFVPAHRLRCACCRLCYYLGPVLDAKDLEGEGGEGRRTVRLFPFEGFAAGARPLELIALLPQLIV